MFFFHPQKLTEVCAVELDSKSRKIEQAVLDLITIFKEKACLPKQASSADVADESGVDKESQDTQGKSRFSETSNGNSPEFIQTFPFIQNFPKKIKNLEIPPKFLRK